MLSNYLSNPSFRRSWFNSQVLIQQTLSLLHIEAGGYIPEHTHKGYELTLLLGGTIEDGDTRYQAGDFIWRDASHAHSPHTPDGCLCYTVQDAPVQFTKGLSRLLNGISHRLY